MRGLSWLVVLVALAVAACGGGNGAARDGGGLDTGGDSVIGPGDTGGDDASGHDAGVGDALPAPSFTVDPTLVPRSMTIAGIAGGPDRALATVSDAKGNRADFVEDELLVSTDDETMFAAFLARWNGTVLSTLDFGQHGLPGAPKLRVVQVNASAADLSQLGHDLRVVDGNSRGTHTISSAAGLHLLSAGAHEAAGGLPVSLNWVVESTAIPDGMTKEDPNGPPPYTPDAFAWPYMNRGSAQDIGVGAAWQALTAAGKLGNRVKMIVVDGGFYPNGDFPPGAVIHGATGWGVPNPAGCFGGGSCPWHGTEVVGAGLGMPDNGFGAAGPAGPIADLIAVQTPSFDLFQIFNFIAGTFDALTSGPRIINMSWVADIPATAGLFVDLIVDAITGILHDAGVLMFAAAGNATADGAHDVDDEDCLIACWEDTAWVPCENDHVICVGGMQWASTAHDPGSNWGTKYLDEHSVDIYAPYAVWMPFLQDYGLPAGRNWAAPGTSFSSPFVAGVAALVWAADPTLGAQDVWDKIHATAHRGGLGPEVTGNDLRVDAFEAVRYTMGGDVPPYLAIDVPAPNTTFHWRNPAGFRAVTWDLDTAGTPTVSWSSDRDGPLGTGVTFNTSSLSVGTHHITATATSGGLTGTASVDVKVVNDPPAVTITEPATSGGTYCTTDNISFTAVVTDYNNPSTAPFPSTGVSWTWTGTTPGTIGGGFHVTHTFPMGSYVVTAKATDEMGLSATAATSIAVASCTDNPPTVNITTPAAGSGSGPDQTVSATGTDSTGEFATVTLAGSATDPEDGTLTGASLVWKTSRSDIQTAMLGTGTLLSVKLYVSNPTMCIGTVDHVVTLTATDSQGASRSVSRVVRVVGLC